MKAKKIFSMLCIAIALLTACETNDFLDQPLRGRQQLDDFFSSPENAELFVNGIYQKVNGEDWFQLNFPRMINEMATDDNWAGNTLQPRPDITGIAAYNVFPGSTYFNLYWEHTYIGITRANIALDRIPQMDIDESIKSRLVAEARFLRGWFYFDLARNFGGLPIVESYNELLGPEILDKTRSTLDETYDFAEQDLLAAIPDLPLKSELGGSRLGRATKGAAQSVLAKVYLYREKWQQSRDMANEVILSSQYELEPLFENIWSVNNPHGVESIFEVEYISNAQFGGIGGQLSTTQGSRGDQGWGWCTPSSHLENAFLEEGDEVRLRSTIIKHGEPVYGDPEVPSFDAVPTENKSGRINRKFYIPINLRPEPYQRGQHPLPFIRIRYADVLLMYAEASYFSSSEGDARSALKLIRDRVGLDTDMSLSGTELRDAIWKERRLELALEQQRLYDLRRQTINGVPRIATTMGPQGSFVIYNLQESTDPFETTNTGEAQNKGINFDINTHLLWPIPPEEIQLSRGNIVQNPGY